MNTRPILLSLAIGFILTGFLCGEARAQFTGSKRIYRQGATPLYLERPSLTDWDSATNVSWSNTAGGGVWEVIDLGGGLYRIESGGKAITRAGSTDWTNAATAAYSGWSTQKWTITANGDGSYRIENGGKALTGDATSGNVVKTAAYSGWTTQKWCFFSEDKTGWPAGDWKWVYRNVSRNTQLLVANSQTLVLNSTVQGVVNTDTATNAILVLNAQHVYIKGSNVLDPQTNVGVTVNGSCDVTVDGCTLSNHVRPSTFHSSFLYIHNSGNVTIRNTVIKDCDGNGIFTDGDASTGLVVDDCVINNTGRVPYSPTAPFHGIYSKAPDVTYTNNTISACNDGSDISMRSTGVISGNFLFGAKHSLIAYWPDAKAGLSSALVISGNTLTQDAYNYVGSTSKAAIVGLNDNGNPNGIVGAYFQTFRIENNQMLVGSGSTGTDAMVTANWPVGSPGFGDARVTGNVMTDQRPVPNYIGNASAFAVSAPNTLQ